MDENGESSRVPAGRAGPGQGNSHQRHPEDHLQAGAGLPVWPLSPPGGAQPRPEGPAERDSLPARLPSGVVGAHLRGSPAVFLLPWFVITTPP